MEERIMGSSPCMYHAATEKGGQAVLRRENAGESDILYIDVPYAGAYGMGEKYNGLNQKGKTAVNQVVEKFCRQGENTYLAAPFFVTDTGLGIYVETAEKQNSVSGRQSNVKYLPKRRYMYLRAR